MVDVVMTECDVIETAGVELVRLYSPVVDIAGYTILWNDSLDDIVDQKDVVLSRWIDVERRAWPDVARNGENGKLSVPETDAPRSSIDHRDSQSREQADDVTRLRRARRIVIPGDHHHDRFGQRLTKTRELLVRVKNRWRRRTHAVKYIAADHDHMDGSVSELTGWLSGTMQLDRRLAWITDTHATIDATSTVPSGSGGAPMVVHTRVTQQLKASRTQ
jgi:hypothetical protein